MVEYKLLYCVQLAILSYRNGGMDGHVCRLCHHVSFRLMSHTNNNPYSIPLHPNSYVIFVSHPFQLSDSHPIKSLSTETEHYYYVIVDWLIIICFQWTLILLSLSVFCQNEIQYNLSNATTFRFEIELGKHNHKHSI